MNRLKQTKRVRQREKQDCDVFVVTAQLHLSSENSQETRSKVLEALGKRLHFSVCAFPSYNVTSEGLLSRRTEVVQRILIIKCERRIHGSHNQQYIHQSRVNYQSV